MQRIMDKIILFIILVLFISNEKLVFMPVVALLTAFTASVLSEYFINTPISAGVQTVYSFLCLFDPFLCLAFPFVSYEIFREKRRSMIIFSLICVFSQLEKFSISKIIFIISAVFISFVLEYWSDKNEKLRQKYIESSDVSRETELYLQNKNKELYENQNMEVHLATLKERNRIAREIHDNVGHMLTRTILQVGALKIVNKDETVGEGLESIKNTLDEAMTSVRKSVHDLHDESVNLSDSINEAVKSIDGKFIMEKNINISDIVPQKIKYALIGIVKESLNNCAKHSNGNKIMLSLQEHPAFYQLVIEDNGTGSDLKKENGIGVENMFERVKSLNGIIRVTPDKNFFRVFVSIPKELKNENCSNR